MEGSHRIAVALTATGLTLILIGISVYRSFQTPKPPGFVTKEQVKQVVDELNKKLTYLSLVDTKGALKLKGNGQPNQDEPIGQYAVSFAGDPVGEVGIFKSECYVIRIDNDLLKITEMSKLCEKIDAMLEEKDEVLKSLKDSKMALELSLWIFGSAKIEISPPKKQLFELVALLRRLFQLKAKKVEVLIRGFADGERGPWKRSLEDNYQYNTVNVLMPLEAWRENWFEYIRDEIPAPMQQPYTNEYLPDLRARFVKEEIVDKFLNGCEGYVKPEVHILKGRADEEPDQAKERKAMIFVNIY